MRLMMLYGVNCTKDVWNHIVPYFKNFEIDYVEYPHEITSTAKKVDDITEGNLAKVDININLSGFIGNNAAIYTNKSFGVPGIKNNIIIIHSIFLGFLNILLFSIFFTFSSSQKS